MSEPITPLAPIALRRVSRATVWLQLHRDFTLNHVRALLDDFAALGIPYLYTSSVTTAQPGSTHGYDVVDPTRVNPELGGEPILECLVEALHARDMGLAVDVVPNHMGVDGAHNAWWLDVLGSGPESAYANFFGIDWQPSHPGLRNKVLAPSLDENYADALAGGRLQLAYKEATACLAIAYYDHRFPIALADYPALLRTGNTDTATHAVADRFARFGTIRPVRTCRECVGETRDVLRNLATTEAGATHIAEAVRTFDAQHDELDALMARQHWRLAHWHIANDEVNWRRFFDIGSLAGLRMERAEVFEATHALLFRLYRLGWIDGVRIGRVDGLADPAAYCRQSRRRLQAEHATRPADRLTNHPWIVVEKTLAHDEAMCTNWGTDGISGYDFINQVGALLHDAYGETAFTQGWLEWIGTPVAQTPSSATVVPARREILHAHFAAELDAATSALHAVTQQERGSHDVMWHAVRRALAEVIVHFPVYRAYANAQQRDVQDAAIMQAALSGAVSCLRRVDQPMLGWFDAWLGGQPAGQDKLHQLALRRCQQLSSPVAAKAMEDTAYYRYGRLLSRNEVGADLGEFSMSANALYHAMQARALTWSHAMLTTAMHDHKRSEDMRARLAVLSERPAQQLAAAHQWQTEHAAWVHHLPTDPAPSPAAQWMPYQTLVGIWSAGFDRHDADTVHDLAERAAQWQEKAQREAKLRTDWFTPDADYEAASHDFVLTLLTGEAALTFLPSLAAFVQSVAPAAAINSLAQTLLRTTLPGVPDLYQGADFRDTSLVDPDSRRPVDYAARHRALRALRAYTGNSLTPLLAHQTDGRTRQAVLAHALALHAALPAVFKSGGYQPLAVTGSGAQHALAFAWTHGADAIVVIVPPHASAMLGHTTTPAFADGARRDTTVSLPSALSHIPLHSAFDGALPLQGPRLALGQVFTPLPVALFYT